MKQTFLITIALLSSVFLKAQDVYIDQKAMINFNATTALEDIEATSNNAVGALNVKDKSVYWKVAMNSFVFRRELMQEHFNENYMESDKYPSGIFKGKINDDVDLTKDGTYNVTATGDFTIHGVSQKRDIPATVVVKGKTVEITSSFPVKVADHQIKIPSVVGQKVAEEVQVKVHGMLQPSGK